MTEDKKLPSIDELDKSIKAAKEKAEGKDRQSNSGGAMRAGIDLLAGVLVGSVIGYQLDKWLDTLPIFFIICFFLGVAGSFRNIYRSATRNNNEE